MMEHCQKTRMKKKPLRCTVGKNVAFLLHLSFEFLPTVYWPLLQKLIYDVFKKWQKYSSSILSTKSCKNTEGKSEVLPKPLETQVNMRMKNQ